VGFGVRAATCHLNKRVPDRALETDGGSESASGVGVQAPAKAAFGVADGPSAHPCALSELLLGEPRLLAEAAKQRSQSGHAPPVMSAEVGDQLGEQRCVASSADQADAVVPPRRSENHMNTEQNKQVVLKLYELLNNGDAERVGELVTPEYVEHDPLPGQGNGRDGVVDRFSMIVGRLAPHFTMEDVIAEDDKVVVRWTNAGTHVAEFAGIPALDNRSPSAASTYIERPTAPSASTGTSSTNCRCSVSWACFRHLPRRYEHPALPMSRRYDAPSQGAASGRRGIPSSAGLLPQHDCVAAATYSPSAGILCGTVAIDQLRFHRRYVRVTVPITAILGLICLRLGISGAPRPLRLRPRSGSRRSGRDVDTQSVVSITRFAAVGIYTLSPCSAGGER